MKISYVTTYDASDVGNWSGLGYYIAKALSDQGANLEYVRALARYPLAARLKFLSYRILARGYHPDRDPVTARRYAERVRSRLSADSDVVFSPGTIPIAMLETARPKVFYSDATFAGMVGFPGRFSNLCRETIAHGHDLERMALTTSTRAIYSSEWAARTAIEHYGIDPAKVSVVPFGANLEHDRDLESVRAAISRRSREECQLLFLAVDWDRKGGAFAVRVAERLNARGVKTRLHVAGIRKVPLRDLPEHVVDHGFLDKRTQGGRERISELIAASHFLILPTRADCTPVVFSEANSLGVPCVTSDVGGITTIVRENVNGMAFPASAGEDEYADYIESVFGDRRRYEQLASSSFTEYEQRLNWDVAGKTIMRLLGDI